MTVNNADTGNQILTNTLTSAAVGNNCRLRYQPGLQLHGHGVAADDCERRKCVDYRAGLVVRYTATFTNSGQTPYTGITIASNSLMCSTTRCQRRSDRTSGTLTLTSTGIAWTGTIPVGGRSQSPGRSRWTMPTPATK